MIVAASLVSAFFFLVMSAEYSAEEITATFFKLIRRFADGEFRASTLHPPPHLTPS
jgi:hypothetical protein